MTNICYYCCKSKLIPARNYSAVLKIARKIFNQNQLNVRRRPYIRSAYFAGEKIFLDNFWTHLMQKDISDRIRRMRFIDVAFELIKKSHFDPIAEKYDKINKREILYRFLGEIDGISFIVQIKEDLKRKQKFFMSVLEYTKK